MNSIEENMWKGEIRLLKRRIKTIQPSSNELTAFYGSSSIRLWENLTEDLVPHKVINLGFGGSSYYWCNYYFDEVFEELAPSRVILYAGDNDLGIETPEDQIIENLSSLIEKIRSKYATVRIAAISVKPSPDRLYLRSKIEHLNDRIKSLMLAENGDFINIYTEMLSPMGSYQPALFIEDQLHMNSKGYEIWKKAVGSYLNQVS